jgi:hypothetical protein
MIVLSYETANEGLGFYHTSQWTDSLLFAEDAGYMLKKFHSATAFSQAKISTMRKFTRLITRHALAHSHLLSQQCRCIVEQNIYIHITI